MQTPTGPINEGSYVILTCDIEGGNPLATITWSCEGSSPNNPTESPPSNTATSSVQLQVNSSYNGRICTCKGHHTTWTPDKTTAIHLMSDVSRNVTGVYIFYVKYLLPKQRTFVERIVK